MLVFSCTSCSHIIDGSTVVDTLPLVCYLSEVLCCTILNHVGDLEFKVMDFKILFNVLVKVFMMRSLEDVDGSTCYYAFCENSY